MPSSLAAPHQRLFWIKSPAKHHRLGRRKCSCEARKGDVASFHRPQFVAVPMLPRWARPRLLGHSEVKEWQPDCRSGGSSEKYCTVCTLARAWLLSRLCCAGTRALLLALDLEQETGAKTCQKRPEASVDGLACGRCHTQPTCPN